MPFTPIHMGPGLLLKSVLQRHFSLMVFGWSQIVMDLQPLAVIVTGEGHMHGFTHTYLGAFVIAIIAALSGKFLAELGLRMLDRTQHLPIRWRVAVISAFIGAYSHVLLDSLMHTDIEPFAPWSLNNPLLGWMTIDHLHLFCVGAGLLGLGLYPLIHHWRMRHSHASGHQAR